jgi:hypothetical protein
MPQGKSKITILVKSAKEKLMSYTITLGGQTYDIPSLPWRMVRDIQPDLLAWFNKNEGNFLKTSTEDLEELSEIVLNVLKKTSQGQSLTQELFDDMPISLTEMVGAVTPILKACGLTFSEPGGGTQDPKAVTGTSS